MTAKPQYGFTPKDWEERTVPLTAEVVAILKRHRKKEAGSALVFPSPQKKESLASPAYLHDRCKYVADLAGLN